MASTLEQVGQAIDARMYPDGTFYVRDNWKGRGYRLYHGEEGALGERMEDGTHRFVCQVDGEISGRVYRTIREAKAECLRRFGREAVRAF